MKANLRAYRTRLRQESRIDRLSRCLMPRPAAPFASISYVKVLSPPPGLSLSDLHVWREPATARSNTSGAIDTDLLEEATPLPARTGG